MAASGCEEVRAGWAPFEDGREAGGWREENLNSLHGGSHTVGALEGVAPPDPDSAVCGSSHEHGALGFVKLAEEVDGGGEDAGVADGGA